MQTQQSTFRYLDIPNRTLLDATIMGNSIVVFITSLHFKKLYASALFQIPRYRQIPPLAQFLAHIRFVNTTAEIPGSNAFTGNLPHKVGCLEANPLRSRPWCDLIFVGNDIPLGRFAVSMFVRQCLAC